jgi:hypothetical protein
MFSNLNIYSCSPATVFSDIDDAIYNDAVEIDEITILRYEIVLRDIRIKFMEKLIKEQEYGCNMWGAISKAFLSNKLTLSVKKS